MYVLIEYNNNYNSILNKLNNLQITPIILFKLNINTKEKIKTQLNKINVLKEKLNNKLFAIQIKLDNFDNSNISFINNLKKDFHLVIGLGGLNKENRFFLEQTQIDFLQDPQNSYLKPKIDYIHHFNSGINQVLGKFAKDKNIGFLFSLNFTNNSNRYLIAKEIGRINQNISVARKYNLPILITFLITNENQIKNKIQLNGIFSLFNISTEQKKESLNILENKIKFNKLKNSKNYINKNIQFK